MNLSTGLTSIIFASSLLSLAPLSANAGGVDVVWNPEDRYVDMPVTATPCSSACDAAEVEGYYNALSGTWPLGYRLNVNGGNGKSISVRIVGHTNGSLTLPRAAVEALGVPPSEAWKYGAVYVTVIDKDVIDSDLYR
jgi:hypothetical protein